MNNRITTRQSVILIIVIEIAFFIIMPTAHGQVMTQEQQEALINYCYQNADRPNPIADLIDKGFLPLGFKGETCLSIKQAYDEEQIRINNEKMIREQRQEEFLKEKLDNGHNMSQYNADRYNECLLNKTMTYEECYNILYGK
jgi:hypothetical protein